MKRAQPKLEPRSSSGLGNFLLLLGWATCFCGTFFEHQAVLIFGFVWSAACLAVLLAVRSSARNIHVTRIAPSTVFEDESVVVAFTLENRGWLPVFFPRIADVFVPEAHEQKELIFTDRLMPGETVQGSYRGFCILPRGVYNYGPTTLRVTDPFGWFEARREVLEDTPWEDEDAPGATGSDWDESQWDANRWSQPDWTETSWAEDGAGRADVEELAHPLRVYPAISDVHPSEDLGDVLTQLVTERARLDPGALDEAIGVREYRPGDSPRWIHWGLTARHQRPVVREFARPLFEDLYVFVDVSREGLVGTGRSSSLDTALRISASLAASALKQGRRVGFTAGSDDHYHKAAAAGDSQLIDILDSMVFLRAREEQSYVATLDERDAAVAAGGTVLLFVSPYLYGDIELAARVRRLTLRGTRVLAVVFEESSFCTVWQGTRSNESIDVALPLLGRAGAECFLARCGVDVSHILSTRAAV